MDDQVKRKYGSWKGCGPQESEWKYVQRVANALDWNQEYEEAYGPSPGTVASQTTTSAHDVTLQTAMKSRLWHARLPC